jgi:hypothetical protein
LRSASRSALIGRAAGRTFRLISELATAFTWRISLSVRFWIAPWFRQAFKYNPTSRLTVASLTERPIAISISCATPTKADVYGFRPHPHVAVFIDLDVNDVRAAADRAVLDVLLA